MSEFNYELKKPFSYAAKGEMVEAHFITVTAPSYKQMTNAAPIKQAFMTAITEVAEKEITKHADVEKSDDESVTGEQVLQLLYSSSSEITKVFLYAEQLFKSGAALVDGDQKLTSELMQKMDMTDFESLVGDYIANFIAPSLMDGQ